MAAVVVHEGEELARFLKRLLQFGRLFRGVRHGLFAEDVETSLQEGVGDREVHLVGRHDGDEIDSFVCGQGELAFHHVLIGGIDAALRNEQTFRHFLGLFIVCSEHAGDQFNVAAKSCRTSVDFANKSSCTAADHTHSDFLLHRCFLFGEMVEVYWING